MDNTPSNNNKLEEQMLRAMSMSIYGKRLESRCRVINADQRAELEAAARQNPPKPLDQGAENKIPPDPEK